MNYQFKEETTFEARKAESSGIRLKYPDRVPVIMEKMSGAQIGDMDKKKFLIPIDINMSQLAWIVRKRIHLEPERALFLYCGKIMPVSSMSVGQAYEEYQDEDGFLYISYSGENTFGSC